jgi:hypothetical protein
MLFRGGFLGCVGRRSPFSTRHQPVGKGWPVRTEVPGPVNLEDLVRHVHARHFLFSSHLSAEAMSSLSLGLIV